jgi:hypothetical protein
MDKLKRCPFCGGEALLEPYRIHCALVLDLEMDLDQIRKKTERWMRRLGME